MRVSSWIRKLFSKSPQFTRQSSRTRLFLETLEDRTAPSANTTVFAPPPRQP
jgi:hypothetical protein